LLRVVLDEKHWLCMETDGEIQMRVGGRRVFTPIPPGVGQNARVYAPEDRLLAAGRLSDIAGKERARKATSIHQPVGRGQLIAFAEDLNACGLVETTQLLFMNAVLFGRAICRPPLTSSNSVR
jgi:hypothetical protein